MGLHLIEWLQYALFWVNHNWFHKLNWSLISYKVWMQSLHHFIVKTIEILCRIVNAWFDSTVHAACFQTSAVVLSIFRSLFILPLCFIQAYDGRYRSTTSETTSQSTFLIAVLNLGELHALETFQVLHLCLLPCS